MANSWHNTEEDAAAGLNGNLLFLFAGNWRMLVRREQAAATCDGTMEDAARGSPLPEVLLVACLRKFAHSHPASLVLEPRALTVSLVKLPPILHAPTC